MPDQVLRSPLLALAIKRTRCDRVSFMNLAVLLAVVMVRALLVRPIQLLGRLDYAAPRAETLLWLTIRYD